MSEWMLAYTAKRESPNLYSDLAAQIPNIEMKVGDPVYGDHLETNVVGHVSAVKVDSNGDTWVKISKKMKI